MLFDLRATMADLTQESSCLPFEVQGSLPAIPLLSGGFPSAAAHFVEQDIFPAVNFQSFPLIREI